MALPFARSADFPVSKGAGDPCVNLRADFGCGVHASLRERGFAGCTVFDCFGAGQRVSQVTFGGRDWRGSPQEAAPMFAAFGVMRQLHELLWYLTEAVTLPAAAEIHDELRAVLVRTEQLAQADAAVLAGLDVGAHRAEANVLLLRASELVRAGLPGRGLDRRGADLIGAKLAGADLRGADLRGAYLIAADLGGADLRGADMIGADLRDANLAGADLSGALFVTQAQVNAARGDGATRLPAAVARPAHWPSAGAQRPARRRGPAGGRAAPGRAAGRAGRRR